MKLALLALCAMLFMMTTAQWCYETSLEWVFFQQFICQDWISSESCYVTFNSQREIYDNFHVFFIVWKMFMENTTNQSDNEIISPQEISAFSTHINQVSV